jgi:hypothetical protein
MNIIELIQSKLTIPDDELAAELTVYVILDIENRLDALV